MTTFTANPTPHTCNRTALQQQLPTISAYINFIQPICLLVMDFGLAHRLLSPSLIVYIPMHNTRPHLQWRFQSCQVTRAGDTCSRAAVKAEFPHEAIGIIDQNLPMQCSGMPGSGTTTAHSSMQPSKQGEWGG